MSDTSKTVTVESTERAYVGTMIGERYRLLEMIGEGGMGSVFRAEHVLMKKTVAIKLLHPDLGRVAEISERFVREAQSASRLSHPNIIQVTDFGKTPEGTLYLVMEYLKGEPLDYVIGRGPLAVNRAVDIIQQILEALDHAHRQGVVHRDLKPENVMLINVDDHAQVKLLDFGIAKMTDSTSVKPLTQVGLVFGTPHYMSPEQAVGQTTDARTDIYACGIILYEMLTGKKPFDSQSLADILSMQLTMPVPAINSVGPNLNIPREVENVILHALTKKHEDRMPSAEAFLEALDRVTHRHGGTAKVRRSGVHVSAAPRPSQPNRHLPRITLTIDLAEMRTRAKAAWRRASLKQKVFSGGLGVGVIALAFVLIAIKGVTPKQASPLAQLDSDMRADIEHIEKTIGRGELVNARALLAAAIAKHPKVAHLYYLNANVGFLQHRYPDMFKGYHTSIHLDASYKTNPVLLSNVASLADDKTQANHALAFLISDVGNQACASFAALAATNRGMHMRQQALMAYEKFLCSAPIDRLQVYLLDLAQAPRCVERRETIKKLVDLKDKRALEPLRKLKRRKNDVLGGLFGTPNDCLARDLNAAIATLEKLR